MARLRTAVRFRLRIALVPGLLPAAVRQALVDSEVIEGSQPVGAQCILCVSPRFSPVVPGPQSHQRLSQLGLIPVAPNEPGPLRCVVVPGRAEQTLELPQLDVAENVPRASLPAPPVRQPPKRGRAHRRGRRRVSRGGVHLEEDGKRWHELAPAEDQQIRSGHVNASPGLVG